MGIKICIDARYLSARPSGIARYSANLIRELARIGAHNEYCVFVHESYRPPEAAPNVRYIGVRDAPLSLGTLFSMGGRIDREHADLVHVTFPVIPLLLRTPLVVTVHDWQPLSVPGFSGLRPWPIPWAYDRFYGWEYPRAVRMARQVMTVSEYAREETIRYVPEAASRTVAIPLGIEEAYADPSASGSSPDRYILFVGSTRPNKQLPVLIEAFEKLIGRGPGLSGVGLVLALSVDRFFVPLRRMVEERGLTSKIRIIQNVEEGELRGLYRKAAVVSMATTHEGFGFPVLEAMASGTPVVIARHGALPEIGGDAALAVSPGDSGALAAAFERVLLEQGIAQELVSKGRKRARLFSWTRTAEATLEVYESARSRATGRS